MRSVVAFVLTAACIVACGSSGNSIGSPLVAGAHGTCNQACIDHATSDCTSQCKASCDGLCEGNMPAANFPYVDRIRCEGAGVTFYEGGSQVTCTP